MAYLGVLVISYRPRIIYRKLLNLSTRFFTIFWREKRDVYIRLQEKNVILDKNNFYLIIITN